MYIHKDLKDCRVAIMKEVPEYFQLPPYDPSEKFPEYRETIASKDNPAYRAVREVLRNLGLDADNFGKTSWNPLGEIIRPGDTVVVKPNWVCHKNHGEKPYGLVDTDSLVTHGSVLRAVLDYVCLALKNKGKVIIGDSPIQNTDWEALMKLVGMKEILKSLSEKFPGISLEVRDFRLERAIVCETFGRERIVGKERREPNPDDFFEIDLGERSLLVPIMKKGKYAFGVANYPRSRMVRAHCPHRNLYLFPRVVLEADVFINVPKIKTHLKAGITCALKNLVGTVSMKDYLPHFRFGGPRKGGDEYPDVNRLWDLKWWLAHEEWERDTGFLKFLLWNAERIAGLGLRLVYRIPRDYWSMAGGGWYGNDTLWRTILDLNRALFYYDQLGHEIRPNPSKSIRYLAIADGLIAGHKESPLCPTPIKTGWILASRNPVAMDTVVSALLGLDFRRIPQVARAYEVETLPLVLFAPDDIEIVGLPGISRVRDIYAKGVFVPCNPPAGWRGYVEYRGE